MKPKNRRGVGKKPNQSFKIDARFCFGAPIGPTYFHPILKSNRVLEILLFFSRFSFFDDPFLVALCDFSRYHSYCSEIIWVKENARRFEIRTKFGKDAEKLGEIERKDGKWKQNWGRESALFLFEI